MAWEREVTASGRGPPLFPPRTSNHVTHVPAESAFAKTNSKSLTRVDLLSPPCLYLKHTNRWRE